MSGDSPAVPRTSEQSVAAFLEAALEAFASAAAARGLQELRFSIASTPVSVSLAGPALAEWATAAVSHHPPSPEAGAPALQVSVFDSASTGVRMPAPPWPRTAYTPTSEIAGLDGDRFLAAYNVGTGVLDLLDTRSGQAVHWIADAARHPSFEVSSPYRVLLHWWMRRRGIQLLHAGAVGRDGRGVLVAGKGGSGKSTVSLACLAAGLDFLGDDYVLARSSPRPEAFNLYGSAKLEGANLEARLGSYRESVRGWTSASGGGKAILMLSESFRGRLRPETELVAIVLPRVVRRAGAALRPAGVEDALQALLPSTCRQLAAVRRADLDETARIARALPAWILEMGPDMEDVPGLVAGLVGGRAA